MSIEVSSWPLSREPIFRVEGGQTAIDIIAASYRPDELLTVSGSGGGSLANARATHFEYYVQDQIDGTTWTPEPRLRALWRKHFESVGEQLRM